MAGRFDFGQRLVIGLGVQKAGTTWLTHHLSQQTDVLCPKKEIHYWDRIRAPYSNNKQVRDILVQRYGRFGALQRLPMVERWAGSKSIFRADPYDHSGYVDFFRRGHSSESVLVDFTPAYGLLSAPVLEEICTLHDDVKFLLLLRDPVDRFWSGLRHRYRKELSRGMAAESLARRAFDILRDPIDPNVLQSRYERMFENPVVASNRTQVSFFETLFNLPSYNRIRKFIGVETYRDPGFDSQNASRHGAMKLPGDLAERAREVFDPAYVATKRLFGDQVPATWRQ